MSLAAPPSTQAVLQPSAASRISGRKPKIKYIPEQYDLPTWSAETEAQIFKHPTDAAAARLGSAVVQCWRSKRPVGSKLGHYREKLWWVAKTRDGTVQTLRSRPELAAWISNFNSSVRASVHPEPAAAGHIHTPVATCKKRTFEPSPGAVAQLACKDRGRVICALASRVAILKPPTRCACGACTCFSLSVWHTHRIYSFV